MYQEGVMGGGGDDWFNVILLTVTNGITVNITDGDEDIDIVGTGLQQAVAIHDENATYTITATQNGFTKTATSVVTDTTNGKLFERELKMAAIEVTFDDEFRSQSFTISDGTTTSSSQTFPASGNTVDIFVPDTGTWKITSTVSGETFESTGVNVTNLNNSYTDTIYVIPNGKTVTPVNDIQLWLACGNIKGKPYTKLEEVLADEITLIKLMSDSNAVDYLKRSTEWIGDGEVPKMTSNTAPSGVASDSQGTANAYKAFDGDDSTVASLSSDLADAYVQYDFTTATKVSKVLCRTGAFTGLTSAEINIFYSDDNITYTLSDSYTMASSEFNTNVEYRISETGKHRYWRISRVLSSAKGGLFATVQFYPEYEGIPDNETAMQAIGAYDYAVTELMDDADWAEALGSSEYTDYILVNAVPILTASTSDVIGSPNGQSGYEAWKVFDGDDSTLYASSGGVTSGYLGYVFPSNVEVLGFRIYERDPSYASYMRVHQLVLEYSTDSGSTWNDVGTFNVSASEAITVLHRAATSIISADRWRVRFIGGNYQSGSSGYAIQVTELGFLVRETGGVQSWLKAAGISKPYTTLDEVIADSDTLATLVTNHAAVDYLVTAKGLIEGITSSAKAMRYIGYRNYCADTLLADSEWTDGILNSPYWKSVLNYEIPQMTSNTTPSGEASASSYYSGSYAPYMAFDRNTSSYWCGGNLNDTLTYDFQKQVHVKKIVYTGIFDGYSGGQAVSFKFQKNDDGNWVDITPTLGGSTSNTGEVLVDAVTDKIKLLEFMANSYGACHELQMYGRVDVDETKITVIGAVNSDIYYKSGATDIPIDTLSGDRKAIDRTAFPTPAGVHRLYSTVAKEPDDSTKDYYKDVVINSDTVEIEMMPEDTFYWYGYGDSDLEDVTTANGWVTAGRNYGLVAPTHNTNNIDTSTGNTANFSAVATKDLQPDLNLVNYIVDKGFTPHESSGAYTCYIVSDKNYSNGDHTVINDPTGFNGHVKLKRAFSIPSIVWGGTKQASNTKVYGMYNTKYNPLANFFGAANDRVYYLDNGNPVYVAEINEIGEAVVDLSSIPSGVILYSSVAKDPDNVSNDYTKLFIPPLTERFYFMPDNALYWYGWVSKDLEEVRSDNGWTPYSGCSFTRPEYKDNYIIIKSNGSSYQSGISSKKASKGMPRAFVQGVTISSSFYGYLYNRSGKSLNAGGLDNVQIDSASLKLYSTNDVDTDKYGVIQVSSSQEAKIYGFWYDKHSSLANFFSAANDRVYYLDNGNPVYVAETNGVGEAWLDLTKIPNGVTLYSSVAKDPDDPNLTDPFSKVFTVGADGKFYLMPDNTLYWWGYNNGLEHCEAANGWTLSGYPFGEVDWHTNDVTTHTNSSAFSYVGTKDAQNTNYLNVIYKGTRFVNNAAGQFDIGTVKNCSMSSSQLIQSAYFTSTTMAKLTLANNGSNFYGCGGSAAATAGRAVEIYAVFGSN